MTSEAKTGIVLLVVVAAAIASWAKLGGLSRFREYEVIVCLMICTAAKGAPVRLRGVDIGKVTAVDVGMDLGCLQARAILSISRKQPLYRKTSSRSLPARCLGIATYW